MLGLGQLTRDLVQVIEEGDALFWLQHVVVIVVVPVDEWLSGRRQSERWQGGCGNGMSDTYSWNNILKLPAKEVGSWGRRLSIFWRLRMVCANNECAVSEQVTHKRADHLPHSPVRSPASRAPPPRWAGKSTRCSSKSRGPRRTAQLQPAGGSCSSKAKHRTSHVSQGPCGTTLAVVAHGLTPNWPHTPSLES